jgi:hypothetical protein
MSPQGGLALLAFHSPHLGPQNPCSTPTTIPICQPSSPQPAQPKEWDTPSLPHSPSSLPISFHGSNAWLDRKCHN